MTRLSLALIAFILVPCFYSSPASGQLALAPVFTDHAVLQRDRPLVVWGSAKPGALVEARLGELSAESMATEKGIWQVTFEAQEASRLPKTLHIRSAGDVIVRKNLLIGDVWHASGQSNMAMTVGAVIKSLPDVEKYIQTYNLPAIRFLKVNEGPSKTPLPTWESQPQWTACSELTSRGFSAAAFFFAEKIYAEVGVPIGIIDSSRGGTPIEPFVPLGAFDSHPTLQRERELGEQDDLDGIWRLSGGVRARSDVWLPARLFHSRIAPIADYAVLGCIWYQGESNCGVQEDPRDYSHKMRALVHGWRQQLGNDKLPFYFVQLPGYAAGKNWPYLREQQRIASKMESVGMVVTIDLEDADIHPANKLDVGHRLARWALAKQYSQEIVTSGPMFSNATLDGRRVVVEFSHAESGLMVANKSGLRPAVEAPAAALKHFELTSDGRQWHAADAEIVSNAVVASCKEVDHPIAIRYAYRPAPANCNLFNRDGLPASPFCSRPELLNGDPGLPELGP